jgi:hypothetical protein
MKFLRIDALAATLVGVTLVVFGADVTGKWKGASESNVSIVLTLKAEGEKLTGTASLNDGPQKEISDGKAEGDRISFSMPSLYGGSTVYVKGKVEGDEMKIEMETPAGTISARLKRQ